MDRNFVAKIFDAIKSERIKQDKDDMSIFDDKHTMNDWVVFISRYVSKAVPMLGTVDDHETEFTENLLKAGALIFAALEAQARNGGMPPRHYDEQGKGYIMDLEKQVCSLELAKELAALGVGVEAYHYWCYHNSGTWDLERWQVGHANWYAAYSSAELGELLPYGCETWHDTDDEWYASTGEIPEPEYCTSSNTEANAKAKLLIWYLEKDGYAEIVDGYPCTFFGPTGSAVIRTDDTEVAEVIEEKDVCDRYLACQLKGLGVEQDSHWAWRDCGQGEWRIERTDADIETRWYAAFTVAELEELLPDDMSVTRRERYDRNTGDRVADVWGCKIRGMDISDMVHHTEADAMVKGLIWFLGKDMVIEDDDSSEMFTEDGWKDWALTCVADAVDHPDHYTAGGLEVIDVIEKKKLGYHLGNAAKYLLRAGIKDPDKWEEDLRKAIWYIERCIQFRKEQEDCD